MVPAGVRGRGHGGAVVLGVARGSGVAGAAAADVRPVVDVPRLTAAYWLDRPDVPAPLLEAAALLRRELGEPFNAVGLNLYRDRNDSVAPHGDKLHTLVPGHPVALLSLGAARRMVIRAKPPAREVHRLELVPGSLLVMSHASQGTHEHGVPKLREPVGERISLAFRVRPPPR